MKSVHWQNMRTSQKRREKHKTSRRHSWKKDRQLVGQPKLSRPSYTFFQRYRASSENIGRTGAPTPPRFFTAYRHNAHARTGGGLYSHECCCSGNS
eukprot:149943-Hanusia_phi.AAC.1